MNYSFSIKDFEGPLDLLLHLVKESKMDIYEINITEIINQYLDFIHKTEEMNIDVASEYLTVASELIHLKSKLLVNINDEEEESDFEFTSAEDLKKKIIDYERYKRITEDFKTLEEKRSEVYTKLPESLKDYAEEGIPVNQNVTIQDLLNAFLEFQERVKKDAPLKTKITKKELSVDDRTRGIRDILKVRKKINFLDLFEEYSKEYVVITLLSILEMSKNNEVLLTQEKNFSAIMIEAK